MFCPLIDEGSILGYHNPDAVLQIKSFLPSSEATSFIYIFMCGLHAIDENSHAWWLRAVTKHGIIDLSLLGYKSSSRTEVYTDGIYWPWAWFYILSMGT